MTRRECAKEFLASVAQSPVLWAMVGFAVGSLAHDYGKIIGFMLAGAVALWLTVGWFWNGLKEMALKIEKGGVNSPPTTPRPPPPQKRREADDQQ
jgi:hypothetical protein